MCGIAGLFNNQNRLSSDGTIQQMCQLIRHRGPNDTGYYEDGQVALGHVRLSIIDLSTRGRNPIYNEDKTVLTVFNGEIYNFKELRADLQRKGHTFSSNTDTEVLVHLYEEKGLDFVSDLNGMFALALWDTTKKRLILARDRFGVKPLYYTRHQGTLAFASEAKAFLALPGYSVSPDPYALAEHFAFQNMLGSRSLFKDVELLPAGNMLIAEEDSITRKQYWDLCFEPDEGMSLNEAAEAVRECFIRATQRQLVSDVPLGTFLSGGMDTGAISAVAAPAIPGLHTFTCGFKLPYNASDLEVHFDERVQSHDLACLLKTRHHEIELNSSHIRQVLPHVVWHLDEPRVGICYQGYYTAEMIHRHVTVVLSGVGGDELFAGYPWRYNQILKTPASQFNQTYYGLWNRILDDKGRNALFTDEMKSALGNYTPMDSFQSVMDGYQGEQDSLHKALYYDFKTFLNGLLLVDDKMSMAHSIEARVPFLDNELIELMTKIPSRYKLQGETGKVVLRKAMKGLLPEQTITHRKQGFTPPDRTWYRKENAQFVKDTILNERAAERGLFQPKAVEQLFEEHLANKKDHRFLLWSLMCTEWWHRLFVDKEPLPEKHHLSPEENVQEYHQ